MGELSRALRWRLSSRAVSFIAFRDRRGPPLLKHPQNPETRGTSGKVFEGMSAYQVTDRENLMVRCFTDFREHVKPSDNVQIRPSRIASRQQEGGKERKDSVYLHRHVEAQIATTMFHGEMPLNHASYANCGQNGKQPKAQFYIDALCNQSSHQRHENDGHRQAVPNESLV